MNKQQDIFYIKLKKIILDKFTGDPIVIAIDGIDNSGKTTLAKHLHALIPNSSLVSIDQFHNNRSKRKQKGELSALGYYLDSFNYDTIIDQVLKKIKTKEDITYRIFDYRKDDYTECRTIYINQTPIIIFEGVFLLRKETVDYFDITIYLDITFEEMIKRATIRDIGNFISKDDLSKTYNYRYVEGQKLYINECSPQTKSNILIDNNNYDNPVIIRLNLN